MARDGLVMEFGVAVGSSLHEIAYAVPQKTVYGFDWFKGLPEDWCPEHPRGSYSCPIPIVPLNTKLVIGLFQDTLKPFLEEYPEPVGFVHIDCDLYSSTLFVLKTIGERLDGAIVAFDEIRGMSDQPQCEEHEGRAFAEFLADRKFTAEHLGDQHSYGSIYRLTRA